MSETGDSPDRIGHYQNIDMSAAQKAAQAAKDYVSKLSTSANSGVHLVYSSHPRWPFLSRAKGAHGSGSGTLDIAVLDSSFNPPSKAHLALLLSPPILTRSEGGLKKDTYDGHLLLFSTNNADKGRGKQGDASLSQRVEMMTLLARDVEKVQEDLGMERNVAVGLVDQPLVFSKSTLTLDRIEEDAKQSVQNSSASDLPRTRLHWVVGFDTLYRVFQLKYYPSESEFKSQCRRFFEKEGTTLVCARRDPSSFPQLNTNQPKDGEDAEAVARREEEDLLSSQYVKPWLEKGSIGLLDLDPKEAALSSTKIRTLLKAQDLSVQEKKARLQELVSPSLVDYLVDHSVYT